MKHILLVDDEPEILEGLALILKPVPDVCIHTACLASHALQLMQQYPVSLVIADIRMPGMSGLEMWDQIQRLSPACRVIFLSGVRDFDNIYRVIQNPGARFLTKMEPEEKILATVQEVLAEVEDQKQQRMEARFRELSAYLLEERRALSSCPASLRSLSLSLSPRVAYLFLVPAHGWAMSSGEKLEALRRFLQAFHRACDGIKPYCLPLREAQALLLLPMDSAAALEKDLLSRVRQVCAALETQYRLSYRCAYGEGVFSPDALHTQYRHFLHWHALENVPQTFILPLQELHLHGHPPKLQAALHQNMRTLQGYIKLGQYEGFLQLTQKMLLEAERTKSRAFLMDNYYCICALLYQQLEGFHDAASQECLGLPLEISLAGEQQWEEAKERLFSCISQVFTQLFPVDPYAHPDMAQGIQRYIRDHLAEDLSLNALSKRFAIHPNYLSRIFRENTGYRLHEYIASLRMSFAAQMLASSNLRVNEIARKAGYDSVHTFIRTFRKQFDCTPAEYRARNGGAK